MLFSCVPWADAGRIADLFIFLNAARSDVLFDHFRSLYTMKPVAILAQAHDAGGGNGGGTFGTETEGCGKGSDDFNETEGQGGADGPGFADHHRRSSSDARGYCRTGDGAEGS